MTNAQETKPNFTQTESNWRFNNSTKQRTSRIYVFEDRETVLENLVNRRCRPMHDYRPFAETEAKELSGHEVEMRWSQKAGCSCGCSPGFVTKDPIYVDGRLVDLFITLKRT